MAPARNWAPRSGRRGEQLGAGLVGDLPRTVLRAAVDDDHLAHEALERRRHERRERRGNVASALRVGMTTEIMGFLWHIAERGNNAEPAEAAAMRPDVLVCSQRPLGCGSSTMTERTVPEEQRQTARIAS